MIDSTTGGSRAFVLGLDGVPWEFIRDTADPSVLPNFSRVLEEGVAGPLQSTIPATTPLAWPSIATGVRPDKHGIYGFQKLTSGYTQQMYSSFDLRQPPLWEMLSPSIVGNVPMTYPASPIDGKMLTGMLSPDLDESSTYPESLRAELLDRVPDYQIGLDWQSYADNEQDFIRDLTDLVEARREAMRLLMESDTWELFFFVYTAPDRLQHLIWERDVLRTHYQHLDRILGEVLEYARTYNATVYIVSDHGFGPIAKYVSVNRILEQNGLLSRNANDAGDDFSFAPSREAISSALTALNIDVDDVKNILPDRLFRTVVSRLPGDSILYDTNFEQTKAFMHGPGNIFVNDSERFVDGCVTPNDRDEVKNAVIDALTGLEDPATGESPITVHDGDDLFPTDTDSPDLVVDKKNGYECKMNFQKAVFSEPNSKAGNHRSTGLFMAWGPAIRNGNSIQDATVYDVAPTLLHELGRPIPQSTDGRVLTDIFVTDSLPEQRTPTRAPYKSTRKGDIEFEDHSEVQERLKGLGYME